MATLGIDEKYKLICVLSDIHRHRWDEGFNAAKGIWADYEESREKAKIGELDSKRKAEEAEKEIRELLGLC